MDPSPHADLAALRGRRIFFGHQSVGENILDGLRALVADASVPFPIVTPGEPLPPEGGLVHARIGTNHDPASKLAHARAIVDGPLAGAVDIALVKFCYVDIDEATDVPALADAYLATLDELARRHRGLACVAVTAPLRHVAGGVGVRVREWLGRVNHAKRAARQRHAFNERLRTGWAGRPLFDLARLESTTPDGRRETFQMDGQEVESLVGAYTDDGGHLTAAGGRLVAAGLIRCLATVG